MIRQFALINADGNRYDLNALTSFMQDPKNLGMERDVDYEQVGNSFLPVQDDLKQKKPQGEIVFETYEEYFAFAQFISRRPLSLEYVAAGTYYLDVYVTKLEKTELDFGGLYCKVKMESLGTYYKAVTVREGKEKTGKQYSYTYPYTYSEFKSGVVTIYSDTDLESPAKLNIYGPCTNPSWAQAVDGEVVLRGKLEVEIESGNKVVVDTTTNPYSIKEYTTNNVFVKDLYKYSDFGTKRFVNIKKGKNNISFAHEGISDVKAIVEAKILYEAV